MQSTIAVTVRKAVKAALNGNWDEAVELNKAILEKTPNDLDAKIRLGRAYLQLSNFTEAKKYFKEALDQDPINQVAKKNYELAKSKKTDTNSNSNKSLIKEPGTTKEVIFEIADKRIKLDTVNKGDDLELKILKGGVKVFTTDSRNLQIGTLDKTISTKIFDAKKAKQGMEATFISEKNDKVKILLRCKTPIFKSPKQEVKPYVKHATIQTDSDD